MKAMKLRGPRRARGTLAAVVAVLLIVAPCLSAHDAEKLIVGHVENVRVFPGGLTLQAKIDTGADHSSLNAQAVERFVRGATTWVRFSLTDRENRSVVIERPVLRTARIRRHAGLVEERDVLLLGICLGSIFKEVEINIVDRSGLSYKMLIGRSFLNGDFLVDAGERFMLEPRCPDAVRE